MARFEPIPDPGGSLDPPRRLPPTALATDAPEPDPEPGLLNEALYRRAVLRCSALLRRINALRGLGPFQAFAHRTLGVLERAGRSLKRALRVGA